MGCEIVRAFGVVVVALSDHVECQDWRSRVVNGVVPGWTDDDYLLGDGVRNWSDAMCESRVGDGSLYPTNVDALRCSLSVGASTRTLVGNSSDNC